MNRDNCAPHDNIRSHRKKKLFVEKTRTRVFMPLQHKLCAAALVPKLDTAVLRAGDDALAIMRDGDGEHIVLVASEVEDALAEALVGLAGVGVGGVEFPVLERLFE